MADLKGVLLIPNAGDPLGFLSGCGVLVRCAFHWDDGVWTLSTVLSPTEALVLAWDGVEDEAGIRRAFSISCPQGVEKTIGLVPGNPPLRRAQHRACYAEWRGLGSWVHVDGDGKAVAGSLRLR